MLKDSIISHINKYKKSYIILSIVFLIGISCGVAIINKLDEKQSEVIQNYFFEYKNNFSNLDTKSLMFNIILNKSKFILVLFIVACVVIFDKVIYIGILYKGFSIGYTISALLKVYGIRKGILLAITTLGIQNIIFIPSILFFANYCIKFCKNMKNNNVDIKRCYFKLFIAFCVIMIISTIFSGLEAVFLCKILKKIQIFY